MTISRVRPALVAAMTLILSGSAVLVAPAMAEQQIGSTSISRAEELRLIKKLKMRGTPEKYRRQSVAISTREAPGTVIVDTHNKYLYLVQSSRKAIRYGVGVGREGFEWNGETTIGNMREWPDWTPPPEMVAREKARGNVVEFTPGGPGNPLGARALYLHSGRADTGFRIHGTNQPWSIGHNLSSGCIRMVNKDVEDLYSRVDMGTKVIVVGPGNKVTNYLKPFNNPLEALFSGEPRGERRSEAPVEPAQRITVGKPKLEASAEKPARESLADQQARWKAAWDARWQSLMPKGKTE